MTNYNPHSNIKFSSISSSCSSPNSSAAINSIMVDDLGLHTMFKQILQKFKGDIKSTFSHLATVHNETCGCQIGLSSHAEITNKVWNQKKVPFMELQKQSGLEFDDYLNRVLRLLVDNDIHNVQPLQEAEFWQTLRQTSFCQSKDANGCQQPIDHCNQETIEEDLADIHSLIASDIGADSSQNLFLQSNNATTSASSVSSASITPSHAPQIEHPSQQHPVSSVSYQNKQYSDNTIKTNTSNIIQTKADSDLKPSSVIQVKYGKSSSKTFSEEIDNRKQSQVKQETENSVISSTSPNSSYYNFDYLDPLNGIDELAKLKRREKHKAPIDCSGVSQAFGYTWFCKLCNLQHAGKHECLYYRNFHNPKYVLKNSLQNDGLPKELMYFPEEMKAKNSKNKPGEGMGNGGIFTGVNGLRAFTRLGPLHGRECAESEIDFDEDRSRVWLVYCDNGVRKCIVTAKR